MAMQLYRHENLFVLNQMSLEKGSVICKGTNESCSEELTQMEGYWMCGKSCSKDCTKMTSIWIDSNEGFNIRSFEREFNK